MCIYKHLCFIHLSVHHGGYGILCCIPSHICTQRIFQALSNRLGSACARFGLIHGPLGDAKECQAQVGGYNMALWLADHHKTPSSHLHLCLWGFWARRVAATHPFHKDVFDRLLLQGSLSISASVYVLLVAVADYFEVQQMILGSSSRSRRQILSEMGYDFIVLVCYRYPTFSRLLFRSPLVRRVVA